MTDNARLFRKLLLICCSSSFVGGLLLITFLLLLRPAPVYAEWVKAFSNSYETVYVDPGTILREGDLVKMMNLRDFNLSQSQGSFSYSSSVLQWQYDCKGKRNRVLGFMNFSGNMGNGTVVYINSDEQKWQPVVPGNLGQTLWNIACGKK